MASVGHIAVGMAAARAYDTRRAPRWTAMAMWSALAMLPDLDVIGFALGVQYGDPWGHRGAAFRSVTPGLSEQDVRSLLGAPHVQDWYFPPRDQPALRAEEAFAGATTRECLGVRFEYGFAVSAIDEDSGGSLGLWIGTSLDDARRVLGPPREACWRYTWSPTGAFHRLRMVCFLNSRVDVVLSRWLKGG